MKFSAKTVTVVVVFCASFLGLRISTQHKQVGREAIEVTLVDLSTQAQAYCNEATGNERNGGHCTGTYGYPSSRCLTPINPVNINCTNSNL